MYNYTFKLASFDENNEFESKKRKKHKKDKHEGNLNQLVLVFNIEHQYVFIFIMLSHTGSSRCIKVALYKMKCFY